MDFTSSGWAAGESVSCYAVSATPPGGATGATQDSGVASARGEVTFEGLAEEKDFVAVGGSGRRVRFRTGVPGSGGGGGGGVPDDESVTFAKLAPDLVQGIKGVVTPDAPGRTGFASEEWLRPSAPGVESVDDDTWVPTV